MIDHNIPELLAGLTDEQIEDLIDGLPEPAANALLMSLQDDERHVTIGDLARAVVGSTYIERPHTDELQDALHEAIERADQGLDSNILISMPPGSGKSMNASVVFPLWLTLNRPTWEIGIVSAEASLAEKFSLDVKMQYDKRGETKSIGGVQNWTVGGAGGVIARGIHGGISGRRLRVAIIDDPIKHLADAYSPKMRERVWNVWQSVVKPRMRPGSIVLSIACMTGDTPVMMSDGSELPLSDVRPGDRVATFDDGRLSTSRILNWASQGEDDLYEIIMSSGVRVRANARHPFLTVDETGREAWLRTKSIRRGTHILRATTESTRALRAQSTDATTPQRLCGCADTTTTRAVRDPVPTPTDTGASGGASNAPQTDAPSLPDPRACVTPTTGRPGEPTGIAPHRLVRSMPPETPTSSTDTASTYPSTTGCSPLKTDDAPSATSGPTRKTPASTRTGTSASTTTTTPARCEVCSATTAILESDTSTTRTSSFGRLSTSFVTDEVLEIAPAGRGEVFDVQVERTENFIANGLVSHNTRWHEDDLNGRLLREQGWTHLVYPAVAELDDALGRTPGEPLLSVQREETPAEASIRWDEAKTAVGSAVFNALYQQHPGDVDGSVFKLEWWRYYQAHELPTADQIITSWDLTFGTGGEEHGDYVVGQAWQRTGNQYYLLDQVRFRGGFTVQLDRMRSFIKRWPQASAHLVEQAANGAAAISTLQRELDAIVPVPVRAANGSKVVRAQSVAPLPEASQVWLPEGRAWLDDYITEMTAFPTGPHDDVVDATSQALTRLRASDVGPVTVTTERPRLGGW